MSGTDRVAAFVVDLRRERIPAAGVAQAKTALLDLLGALIGGAALPAARAARYWAATSWPGTEAGIWPGQETSNVSGAVFANAVAANALDVDDGFRAVKGHPGACVIPAALATAEHCDSSGEDLLVAIVAGYEVAIRAGIVLHQEYDEYHCSGSWGALGAAAATARLRGSSVAELSRALAVAEYHAPIGAMMRCIDHPAMVKDGIAAGALAGTMACQLAALGFNGPPHLLHPSATLSQKALDACRMLPPLGDTYLIEHIYFKRHASCRWAQPAIDAVLDLKFRGDVDPERIERIRVHTFREATRIAITEPTTAEEAQYSLPWPVACALLFDRVGPQELTDGVLRDERARALAKRVELIDEPELDAVFPNTARAWVEVTLVDGTELVSAMHEAIGEPHQPLSTDALQVKFSALASRAVGATPAAEIAALVDELESQATLHRLWDALRGGRPTRPNESR